MVDHVDQDLSAASTVVGPEVGSYPRRHRQSCASSHIPYDRYHLVRRLVEKEDGDIEEGRGYWASLQNPGLVSDDAAASYMMSYASHRTIALPQLSILIRTPDLRRPPSVSLSDGTNGRVFGGLVIPIRFHINIDIHTTTKAGHASAHRFKPHPTKASLGPRRLGHS